MRNHLYPLDLLRFFAALCVLTYHLGFYGWASHYSSTSIMLNGAARFEPLAPVAWFGWVGVEIFFIISGFVIANSAYGRSPIAFLKGRLIRLYPAAWVCATITLLAWLILGAAPLHEVLPRYVRSVSLWLTGPWIDGVYWSLAVEIVFYALVFWVLAAGRIVSIMAMPWALTALSVVFALIVWTPLSALADANPIAALILHHADILMLRFGCFFAAGIWLWMMMNKQLTPVRYAGLAVAVLCCLSTIALRAREISWGEVDVDMPMPVWAPWTAWTLAFAFVVVVARRPHWFEVKGRRLQTVFKRVGLMTYPMFLVHNILGAGLIRLLTGFGVNKWAALAMAVVAVLALAYAVCAFAEPAIRERMRAALDGVEARLRAWSAQGKKRAA
jgi:peptidoglycan/LPS O-acetylase OafA/YrhL